MTAIQSLQSAIELFLILLVAYGIFRREALVRFERKAWFYTKVFFKAVYITVCQWVNKKKSANQPEIIKIEKPFTPVETAQSQFTVEYNVA